jgi:hypothetical protein
METFCCEKKVKFEEEALWNTTASSMLAFLLA